MGEGAIARASTKHSMANMHIISMVKPNGMFYSTGYFTESFCSMWRN